MQRLAEAYGRLLDGMMLAACILLLAMTFLIGLDVLLRNVGAGGIPPSNELSEYALYLMTILAAPALLRRGQHIRIDIVLRMFPPPAVKVRGKDLADGLASAYQQFAADDAVLT